MVRFVAVATLVLFLASQSYALTGDPLQDALIAGLDHGAEESAAAIMTRFRQVASADEIKVINRLRVVIDRSDLRIADVFTDGRSIHISSGFLVYSAPLSNALAYEIAEGMRNNVNPNTDQVIAYTRYFVDGVRAQQAAFERGQSTVPIKNYFVWKGMSADAAQSTFKSLNSDIVYQQAQSLVLISSLAFVLGHEFGHNVLNQFDTENNYQLRRPPNPEDEAAADAYGFQIVVRAGMSPFFALGIFMLLDAFERDPGGPPFAGDHPPALCRWGRAMVAGWNGVKDDPAFWVQVRARGREEEAKKVEPAVRAIEDQLSVNCPTGVNAGNICLLVEKFLMESADAFTADRGEALKPNKWRSRSRFPNANCYQGERDQTFTFSCIINSDGKLPDVQAFYEGVKPQLGACLARHGGPGSWGVKSVLTNDGDETVNGVGYSRASATGTYEIELDTTTERDDHTSYNYLRVDYNPR